MKKEIPILFSTPMVQAILTGRKTQTRRIVAPGRNQKWLTDDLLLKSPSAYPCIIKDEQWAQFRHPLAGQFAHGVQVEDDSPLTCVKCPYGKPGDILWGREKWFPAATNGNKVLVGYDQDDAKQTFEFTTGDVDYYWRQMDKARYIPSIHMPKEAARIWLEVTDLKVERLAQICHNDAIAEGIDRIAPIANITQYKNYLNPADSFNDPVHSFRSLWQSINGPASWNSNPWVWVVSFKVLSTIGKPELLTEQTTA